MKKSNVNLVHSIFRVYSAFRPMKAGMGSRDPGKNKWKWMDGWKFICILLFESLCLKSKSFKALIQHWDIQHISYGGTVFVESPED